MSDNPTETHPTAALRKRIEATNTLGGARCLACGKCGYVSLDIFDEAELTLHHRIPKLWWSVPGRARTYYVSRQHRGVVYWRDSYTNLVEVCHECHKIVSRLPIIVPDLMGNKLRAILAKDIAPLVEKKPKIWPLFPDIVAEEAFEITLEAIRALEQARAQWEREVEDA